VADNSFSPTTATVARGGTVTWRWTGKKSHDVVGPGFKSKLIKTGTFKKTFTKQGTFNYVCTLHRGMKGTVRVK
jgi:plastocyanin